MRTGLLALFLVGACAATARKVAPAPRISSEARSADAPRKSRSIVGADGTVHALAWCEPGAESCLELARIDVAAGERVAKVMVTPDEDVVLVMRARRDGSCVVEPRYTTGGGGEPFACDARSLIDLTPAGLVLHRTSGGICAAGAEVHLTSGLELWRTSGCWVDAAPSRAYVLTGTSRHGAATVDTIEITALAPEFPVVARFSVPAFDRALQARWTGDHVTVSWTGGQRRVALSGAGASR